MYGVVLNTDTLCLFWKAIAQLCQHRHPKWRHIFCQVSPSAFWSEEVQVNERSLLQYHNMKCCWTSVKSWGSYVLWRSINIWWHVSHTLNRSSVTQCFDCGLNMWQWFWISIPGTTTVLTSKVIYHQGGDPEWAMHCWLVMDNSKMCHCLLFHEHGKQNFVQPFLRSRKLLQLHTCLD